MSEQNTLEPEEEEVELAQGDQALEVVEETLGDFLAAASVDAVYGQPVKKGDLLIIPAAEVVAGLGFGVGYGYGSGKAEENSGEGTGGGGGGGGGGRVFSRPVAVIIASPEGVRVEPVLDLTKIALAGLTAGAFMVGMFLRLFTPKKAIKELQEGEWG